MSSPDRPEDIVLASEAKLDSSESMIYGEELTDLEDAFGLWRFRHVTTVECVIGSRRSSGGTSGVNDLRTMLDPLLFPDIWPLRTHL